MESLQRVVNGISDWSGKVTSYLVWIGAIMLSWEVVSRYFFNAPTVWAHGYTQRIFGVYFIMIGAFTLLKDGHVRVDLITQRFSFRTKIGFDILNYVILLIWCAVLLKEGWLFFLSSLDLKEVDEMVLAHPVYPFKFILIVGVVLIALQGTSFLISSFIALIRGEDNEP